MYLFALFVAMVVAVLTYLAFDFYITKKADEKVEDKEAYNEDVVSTMESMRQQLKEHLNKQNKED